LECFPDFQTLAEAPGKDVLGVWNGLGYNRRALYLQRIAQIVVKDYHAKLPTDPVALQNLPGIGAGTAGSIAAFAFDAPVTFIETNIRRVFIHHFFSPKILLRQRADQDDEGGIKDSPSVQDSELLPLITEMLDRDKPREWYWALMDYGSWLAGQTENPNRRSKHYAKQSKFEGSPRQLRGEVLRRLLVEPQEVAGLPEDERLPTILEDLVKEGFIVREGELYKIR
jgi:A/G-specific adenine glycosylase